MNKKMISVLVVLAVVLGGFGGATLMHKDAGDSAVQAATQDPAAEAPADQSEQAEAAGQTDGQEASENSAAEAPEEEPAEQTDPEDSSNSEGCVSDDAENFY